VDALDGKFSLLLSTSLLLEYESVLRRPENLGRASASEPEVTEVLDALAGLCVPVLFDYQWRPTGAHADDELVMETAINGQADAIVTFNLSHMYTAAKKFGFQALRPATVLRSLRL